VESPKVMRTKRGSIDSPKKKKKVMNKPTDYKSSCLAMIYGKILNTGQAKL